MRNAPANSSIPAPIATQATSTEPLLEQLLARSVAAPSRVTTRRRSTLSTYDRITRRLGLVVGLFFMALLWLTGGYFTLTWLSTLGLPYATAGVNLVDWMLGQADKPTVSAMIGVLGWCIPIAITVAEVGLWPARVPHPFSWLIWSAFLLVDSGTTAAGMVSLIALDPLTSWAISLVLGMVLALVPEKGVRYLWELLTEG